MDKKAAGGEPDNAQSPARREVVPDYIQDGCGYYLEDDMVGHAINRTHKMGSLDSSLIQYG